MKQNKNDQAVFWGSFIALVTTSMAFIIRAILINSGIWPEQFGLDKVQSGVLFGAGIWPFAISIIGPRTPLRTFIPLLAPHAVFLFVLL